MFQFEALWHLCRQNKGEVNPAFMAALASSGNHRIGYTLSDEVRHNAGSADLDQGAEMHAFVCWGPVYSELDGFTPDPGVQEIGLVGAQPQT